MKSRDMTHSNVLAKMAPAPIEAAINFNVHGDAAVEG